MFLLLYTYGRIRLHGNPLEYNTFKDESLNLVIRTVAQHVHPARVEVRIFEACELIGKLDADSFWFGM
jgi:hypothetical protein